jgi:hypothetical protein
MIHWRFFTDAGDEPKARKVLGWVLEKLQVEPSNLQIERYHKGGFVLAFYSEPTGPEWPETVLGVLTSAERVGHGWLLTGSITQIVDASCNKPSVAGVTFIHIVCSHDAHA